MIFKFDNDTIIDGRESSVRLIIKLMRSNKTRIVDNVCAL